MTPPIPKPRRGLLHILDAAGYSLAGARRLWRETAARIEICGAILGCFLLAATGAALASILIFAALCAFVLIVEALNTALEEVVDHISPEWSEMAKHAKDLGSLAVALALFLAGLYLGYACLIP